MKNATLINLLGFLLITSFATHAKAQETSDLLRRRECIYMAEGEIHQYKRLLNIWLDDESSALNISREFKEIDSKQLAALDQLENFAKKSQVPASTLIALSDQIASIDHQAYEIRNSWLELRARETAFISSLWEIERGLASAKTRAEQTLKHCQGTVVIPKITQLLKDTDSWLTKTGTIRLVVTSAQAKRPLLLSVLTLSLQQKLEEVYAQRTSQDLGQIKAQIESLLKGARLLSKVKHWWVHTSATSTSDLDTLYLQYAEPMRLFASDLGQLSSFAQEANQTKEINAEMLTQILNEIRAYQNMAQGRLSQLKANGWQGQLNRQLFLNGRRMQAIHQYRMGCQTAIKAHKTAANAVKNESSFEYAEAAYASVIATCRGN